MSSWGNNDNAANAPLWAAETVNLKPNRSNTTLLYANTTANAFIGNTTIGLFGVSSDEASVSGTHTGWVLKTTGIGGRAGRVHQEVLVAMNTMRGDGDAQVYANVTITLSGPSNKSVLTNAAFANVATFTVVPTLKGNTNSTLTYTWYKNNTSGSLGWVAVANNDVSNVHVSGFNTSTLSIAPATAANNATVYRVVVDAADQGVSSTSSNATITVA